MASTINALTGSGGVAILGDTSGEIELQSAGVTKAKVTSSGLQNASGVAITAQSGKNLIINGNMQIAQRAQSVTGITSSSGTYSTMDRFQDIVRTVGTWTQTQDTDVPTGQGFATSLKMDCTTANGSLSADSWLRWQTQLEGFNCQPLKFGTANAESITLSFWVKSNKTGTYCIELYQTDSGRAISKSYTIDSANTYEKKELTFVGDTAGNISNDNGSGFIVSYWFAAGANYQSGTLQTSWGAITTANRAVGQVNLADSTSNYINITGIQLETGTTATPFENLQYGQQLLLCQRYYEYGTRNFYGSTDAPGNIVSEETYKVVKRATPTMVYGTWSYARSGTGGTGSPINYQTNINKWSCYIGTGLGYAVANSAGSWTASSEL